jgi:hypothetical protein
MKHLISRTVRPGLIGLFIVFSLIIAACSSSVAGEASSPVLPATGGETVQIANDPEFGQLLVTPDGKRYIRMLIS